MSTTPDKLIDVQTMIALAKGIAAKHSLDPILVCAQVEQESAWNTFAIRYEPGFLSKYVAKFYTAGKLTATETYSRAFSWGLMQIMGQTAREFGFSGISLAELCDPETGVEFGCRKLESCMFRAKGDVNAALLAYNGGSNAQYASEVLARQAKYR